MAYSKKVIDKFEKTLKDPEKNNVGRWDPSQVDIGTGMVGAPACGDVMKFQIEVQDDKIVDSKFKTFGCGSAIASSSFGSEYIKGKTLNEAHDISNKEIAGFLKLPPVKLHCSMLMEDAIKGAIEDYKKKN